MVGVSSILALLESMQEVHYAEMLRRGRDCDRSFTPLIFEVGIEVAEPYHR